ncbi:MAG TPA: KTSC domain-containing protein [Pirellulales bacterium]|jgi:hypothetical protein|nr:KTSC domain-containing protein [Pirellulales bacterium]
MARSPFNPNSQLFRMASRRLRRSAVEAYRRSDFGRAVGEFNAAARTSPPSPTSLSRLVKTFQRRGQGSLLRELEKSDAGRLAAEIEKYAKRGGPSRQLIEQMLDALGSTGKLIKALSGTLSGRHAKAPSRGALQSAIDLLNAFGHGVLVNPRLASAGEVAQGLAIAKAYLEQTPGGLPGARAAGMGQVPPAPPPEPRRGRGEPQGGRKTVDVPRGIGGGNIRVPPDHPLVTGDMVPSPNSSNVHSFGYDQDSWYLYVRFLAPDPGNPGKKSSNPGPLYRYAAVRPEQFLQLYKASSKGGWVWDHLRVRGTVSGHQKDYELVGIVAGYVPRKATLKPEGEYYIGRTVRGEGGRGITSSKPDVLVRPLHSPNTGRPRGPNRGEPNRGRP